MFFVSILLVVFPLHWILMPSLSAWKICYVIAIGIGVFVGLLLWNGRVRA